MIGASKVDYRIYRKFKWIIYVGLVALLVLVGVSGSVAGGGRRWINIGGFFSFQPSEISKVGFIIFFAAILSDMKEQNRIKKITPGFFYPILLLVPIVISIYILQNHFSATLVIVAITCVQMFVAGTRLTHFFAAGGLGVAGFAAIIMKKMATGGSEFRIKRLQTWLNIEEDITGAGWQINQSLYAIGSGGLFGLGLGKSRQKYLYLPEPQNDFIFSVIAEELGFFGSVIIIILFAVFVWRGIVIAMRAEDTFGTLIAIGLTTMIGLQALINIAVVTNSMPVTGMPLPFFSYGGTAIITDLIAVGILLSISRNKK